MLQLLGDGVRGGEQAGDVLAERHHAGARQRGHVHHGLHPALLLRIPQRVRQRQPALGIGVVNLRSFASACQTVKPLAHRHHQEAFGRL